MSERRFEQSMNPKEHIQSELEDAGISHPNEWRKAFDLETRLKSEHESSKEFLDIIDFNKIFTYLEDSDRVCDQNKIEVFGRLTDSLERLTLLQSMGFEEATRAIRDFGLTSGAYSYLARRLKFYQACIAGEATKKVKTNRWDSEKQEYVNVVKEELIDSSDLSPETIKLGFKRDVYYAAMQGTPEMGAIKIATKKINAEREDKTQLQHSNDLYRKTPIKSVIELHGYYSGIFEGSLGLYSEVCHLYKQCEQEIKKRFHNNNLDEKELEHKAVLLMARRLEGACKYAGIIRASESPYNPSFKESIIVGQLGDGVMRQMRGMRNKIQETDFDNVERFIGKSGDSRYQHEKKRIDKDVIALEDFVANNHYDDAHFLTVKNEDGSDRNVKGNEAAEIMTRQKNGEAIKRADLWFTKKSEKINHWLEKSKIKIAEYDISEEERNSIYQIVQDRYDKKISDLEQEYEVEITRLKNRSPEELLESLKERQGIVNKRFEKRKSLAQKAIDLHFHFNHEGRKYDSKPFDQIDWINSAPFGVIKRAHRALNAGVDDLTIIMRALSEINNDSSDYQSPGDFARSLCKSRSLNKVIRNFEKFSVPEDLHLHIFLTAINQGYGRYAPENLTKFTGIEPEDHLQIAQALNESGLGHEVVANFQKFDGIQEKDKKDLILGAIKARGGYTLACALDDFSGIISETDHQDIVIEMMKAGHSWYLNKPEVLDKLTGLNESLRQVIKAGKHESLPYVLEAGFSVEEVTRFPFLISELVTKK
jgi:hypothetical protein